MSQDRQTKEPPCVIAIEQGDGRIRYVHKYQLFPAAEESDYLTCLEMDDAEVFFSPMAAIAAKMELSDEFPGDDFSVVTYKSMTYIKKCTEEMVNI